MHPSREKMKDNLKYHEIQLLIVDYKYAIDITKAFLNHCTTPELIELHVNAIKGYEEKLKELTRQLEKDRIKYE